MSKHTIQAVSLFLVLEGLLLWRGFTDPHLGFRAEIGFCAVLLALWFGVNLRADTRRL